MSSFLEKLKKGMGVEGLNEEEVFAENSTTDKVKKEPQKSETEIKPDGNKAKKKKIAQEKKAKESFQKKLNQKEKPEKTKKLGPVPNKEEELKITEQEEKEKKQQFEPARQSFALQNLGESEGQLVVDVFQTDGEIVVQSAVAGVKPDELDISVENDVLTIKGKRERPAEKEPTNYFYQECYWGKFSREIILPAEVDHSRTKATIKEGVLTIRIPKIDRETKRKISVKE